MSERKTKTFFEDDVSLEGFEKSIKNLPKDERRIIEEVAKKSNFSSRGDLKKISKKRTPYVLQKNIKMRVGMIELLEEITEKIEARSEQEAIEVALGALIENQGDPALKERYDKILKDDGLS